MAAALPDSTLHHAAQAPAVRYPLAQPRGLHKLLLLCWGLAVVVDGYWLAVAPAGDWRPWLGLLATAVAGALAWRAGPMVQAGVLVWDGAFWWWERAQEAVAGRVAVRLDVQSGLLLRFVADSGAPCWFWLGRHGNPAHWMALRRAVYAAPAHDGASSPADGNRTVVS